MTNDIRKYINLITESTVEEKWKEPAKISPTEKGKYEGKTKTELLKQYNALKASGPHRKGSADYGKMKELAFAIRAKTGWGNVKESSVEETNVDNVTVEVHTTGPIEEKWGVETKTKPKDIGKWEGWTLAELRARKKKLMDKPSRTSAESKEVRQINFAIRAKTGWGKATEE